MEARTLLAAGDLDPTFGDGGLVTGSFPGPADDWAHDVVVVQNDGKIVVGGMSASFGRGLDGDFALARYNSDGSLDSTFGSEGQVTTDFDKGVEQINAMALQSDGGIVAVGWHSAEPRGDKKFIIARYSSYGAVDNTFGDGGKVLLDLGGWYEEATDVGIQSDGKIVVAGWVNWDGYSDFVLARFNSDGSLDDAFGTGGWVATDFESSADQACDMAIQTDGKIVVGGNSRQPTTGSDFAIARYNTDGSLDAGFGVAGKVLTDLGHTDSRYESLRSVAVQADGKIVAAGSARPGSNIEFAVVRYNTDGSLDDGSENDSTSDDVFGTGGWVTTDFGSTNASAYDMALQADGKIVLAGHVDTDLIGSGDDFALARYETDGRLDVGFGTGGTLTADSESQFETAAGVAIQTDGKILAAGWSLQPATRIDFALARFNPDGSLDDGSPSDSTPDVFGAAGWVMTNFDGPAPSYGQDLALQPDGKIVVAGLVSLTDRTVPGLARFNVDGTLDSGFGNGGKVTGSLRGDASAVALQADGKILIVGSSTWAGTGSDFEITRFNIDGSLDDGGPNDTTPGDAFGVDGRVSADFSAGEPSSDYATGLAVQTDGKIVVTGYSYTFATGNDIAVARYNADGTPDVTFGVGGQVLNDFGLGSVVTLDMALQADERIVVVGYSQSDVFAGRFNADGSIDDGTAEDLTPGDEFGDGGKVLTDFGSDVDQARGVAIQAENKIVVAGLTRESDGDYVFALARYNSDGSPDATFDGDGMLTTDFGSSGAFANCVAIAPDGKIVAAGKSYVRDVGTDDIALARYNPDGTLDSQFGDGGRVITDIDGTHDYAFGIAVQDDANIVLAGYTSSPSFPISNRFLAARYIGDPPPVVLGVDVGLDLQSLTIQLNDDDLDPASTADLTNYVLKASGGDGNGDGDWFNDGDEILLDITAAHYDNGLDQIVLEVGDVLFEDLFWLQVDGDDATSDGTAGITDAAGHHLAGGDFNAEIDLSSLTLIDNMLNDIEDLGLSTGAESSLTAKLEAVLRMLDVAVEQSNGVLALMDAFIRGVEHWYSRNEISLDDRDNLIDQAQLIKLGFTLLDESDV